MQSKQRIVNNATVTCKRRTTDSTNIYRQKKQLTKCQHFCSIFNFTKTHPPPDSKNVDIFTVTFEKKYYRKLNFTPK